jgi:hypothetical protein
MAGDDPNFEAKAADMIALYRRGQSGRTLRLLVSAIQASDARRPDP